MKTASVRLVQAETPDEFEQGRSLFREYAEALSFDLCFQDFEHELEQLPSVYGASEGRLLLVYSGPELAGCVGVRRFAPGICEMKRMYLRPQFRGQGIGRQMATAIVNAARALGYQEMRLDTVPWMKEAIALYESLGFQDIAPYRPNPIPGARYLQLVL